MRWEVRYIPEAEKDYRSLGRNQQLMVDKAIKKVKAFLWELLKDAPQVDKGDA